MSNQRKKSKKQKRDLYTIELPPEMRPRLAKIALANNMPLAVVTRMCLTGGLPIVESKLAEPAAMPA